MLGASRRHPKRLYQHFLLTNPIEYLSGYNERLQFQWRLAVIIALASSSWLVGHGKFEAAKQSLLRLTSKTSSNSSLFMEPCLCDGMLLKLGST